MKTRHDEGTLSRAEEDVYDTQKREHDQAAKNLKTQIAVSEAAVSDTQFEEQDALARVKGATPLEAGHGDERNDGTLFPKMPADLVQTGLRFSNPDLLTGVFINENTGYGEVVSRDPNTGWVAEENPYESTRQGGGGTAVYRVGDYRTDVSGKSNPEYRFQVWYAPTEPIKIAEWFLFKEKIDRNWNRNVSEGTLGSGDRTPVSSTPIMRSQQRQR